VSRWFQFAAAVGVAALLVLVPGHVTPAAYADTIIPPSAPSPINGLPSTVIGSSSPSWSGPARVQYQMALLYSWAKKPAFWQAVSAHQAGIATPTQTALMTTEQATKRQPLTLGSAAVKTIGGAAIALTGFDFATSLTSSGLEMVGVDVDGLVCRQGDAAGFLSLLTGADCSALELATGYPINTDAFGKAEGWTNSGTWVKPGWYYTGSPNSSGAYSFQCQLQPAVIVGSSVTFGCTEYGSFGSPGTSAGHLGSGRLWCKNTTTGAMTSISRQALLWGADTTLTLPAEAGTTGTRTYTCAAGSVPYSMVTSSSTTQTSTTWDYTASGIQWFSNLSPLYTPATEGDPDRTLRCVVLGDDANLYTATSEPYRESDGVLPKPVCPTLPPGVLVDTTTLIEDSPMGSTELWSESVTPEWSAAQSLAPECSTAPCMLDLRTVGTGLSCFQTPTECAEWFADPNRDTDYSCHYGTHAVDLTECYVYAPTFKPDAQSTGELYADPETGTTVGAPAGAAPGSDGSTFGSTVQDPEGSRECFPTGWAVLNPVEWVMKPVQCALQWAFVPRTSVLNTQVATMTATMEGTLPGQLVGAIAGWEFVAPESGCDGITVDVWFLGPPFQIMQACPGDMLEPLAIMSRIFGNLGFSIYGIVAITRHVARIFDFPGLGDGS
jgi:hypothetical protein